MNHCTHLLLDMVMPNIWEVLPVYIKAVITSIPDIIRNDFESACNSVLDFFAGLFQKI